MCTTTALHEVEIQGLFDVYLSRGDVYLYFLAGFLREIMNALIFSFPAFGRELVRHLPRGKPFPHRSLFVHFV